MRPRDLVEMELSHRAGPWPIRAIVVPLRYADTDAGAKRGHE